MPLGEKGMRTGNCDPLSMLHSLLHAHMKQNISCNRGRGKLTWNIQKFPKAVVQESLGCVNNCCKRIDLHQCNFLFHSHLHAFIYREQQTFLIDWYNLHYLSNWKVVHNMRSRKCFADVIAAHQFLMWATKIKLVTMAIKWRAGRSWVWGKSDRKIEEEGWESTRSASTAGPFFFFLCARRQMPIQGSSGCREAGERHPPTQRRGLCCVAEKREGGRAMWKEMRAA